MKKENIKTILLECKKILENPEIESWYNKNLLDHNQKDTLKQLDNAIFQDEISAYDALHIAFLVGFQALTKFKGVK